MCNDIYSDKDILDAAEKLYEMSNLMVKNKKYKKDIDKVYEIVHQLRYNGSSTALKKERW